jgi:uncharacterized protein
MNLAPVYLRHIVPVIFSALLLPIIAQAASFDCGKAVTEVEKLICSDEDLSRLDESLNREYLEALKRTDIKEHIIKSQRQWLKYERNLCENAVCLKIVYETRIKELFAFITSASRSPGWTKTTVFDWRNTPAVNLKKLQPLSEGMKAILAMYALQAGAGCEGGKSTLRCSLIRRLGLGPQCSRKHLTLGSSGFKDGMPHMSGYHPEVCRGASTEELRSICYKAPDSASFQETWSVIRVEKKNDMVIIHAVCSWIARGNHGEVRYRTVYRINRRDITVLSHHRAACRNEECDLPKRQ